MSDTRDAPVASTTETAGGLLRQARQAQGLHIAALAASIKVAQRKLELLEADRLDELPDATFTRALAQTVCRSLKIDSAPVLALLPQLPGHRLEHLSAGLNTPFRERPGQATAPRAWARLAGPAVWGPALLLVAAMGVYFMPAGLFQGWADVKPFSAEDPAPVVESVSPDVVGTEDAGALAPAAPATPDAVDRIEFVTPAFAASDPLPAASEATAMVPLTDAMLQIRTTAESWVDVRDRRGKLILSRKVVPGEPAALDGAAPLKVRIGNAAATELVFRGEPVDLGPLSRNNVARVELK
jgi:cytoskeleton protein RodZ